MNHAATAPTTPICESPSKPVGITEQGETIAQKYANRITATHNLELLTAGAVRRTLLDHRQPVPDPSLADAFDRLASASREAYRALVEADGFVAFFSRATPIDVIEQSRMGSRPARRTGERTLADLRAIPWVFSWSQSRFYLSGWFGVGSALAGLKAEEPDTFADAGSSEAGPQLAAARLHLRQRIDQRDDRGPRADAGVRQPRRGRRAAKALSGRDSRGCLMRTSG